MAPYTWTVDVIQRLSDMITSLTSISTSNGNNEAY